MRWHGPRLDDDQRQLARVLDGLSERHGVVLSDDPASVRGLVGDLAALGLWTLGTPEHLGGGGADLLTTAVALERLGRSWPALGWASVQAHIAVEVLGGSPHGDAASQEFHQGIAGVAVVDGDSPAVRLSVDSGRIRGAVDRVDAAAERPYVLVLGGPVSGARGHALLVPPSLVAEATALRRTGLSGGLTRRLRLDGPADAALRVENTAWDRARYRLAARAAAVLAGIAGAAADAAGEYAAARRQFGRPLAEIPAVARTLADQRAAAELALTTATAAGAASTEAESVLRGACDLAIAVCGGSLQTHGGYGYLTEFGAERRLRDAVSFQAALGCAGLVTRPDTQEATA